METKTVFCLVRDNQPLNFHAPIMGRPRFIVARELQDITTFDTSLTARSFISYCVEKSIVDVTGVGTAELTYSIKVVDSKIKTR